MPYHVEKSSSCPSDKPWACVKSSDGTVMGCHSDKQGAMDQMAALYANEKNSMGDQIERRFCPVEFRISGDADRPPIIEGHAAVFNKPSEEIFVTEGWREIIRPGAFTKAIKKDDVRALINHKDDRLIGRTSNGSLTLEEDDIGLKVRIFPPDTTDGRDVLTLIRGRYMTQMSFGFTLGEEKLNREAKLREIVEVNRLYDVSPVTLPAYPDTDVGLRTFFNAKIAALSQEKPQESLEKRLFESRVKEREEFFLRRTPPADPLSYPEILKRCGAK